jgi:hypothetical protein
MVACEGRPKKVLSEDKMANVLVEMHKTDAVIAEKGIVNGSYSSKAPFYKFIFIKYGITQSQFDSSLVWYTKNPQRFNNVYDNVISQLSDFKKNVEKGIYHPEEMAELGRVKSDIWNKATKYTFTKDSVRTHLDFEIKDDNLLYGDLYVLKLRLFIAREDSSKNKHLVMRINYFNGKNDSAYQVLHNDGLTRHYKIRMSAHRKLKIKSISGQLLGSKGYKGVFHVAVDSIRLIREFFPMQRDSLLKIVQKADPKNFKTIQKINPPTKTIPGKRILKKYQKITPV